MNTLTHISTLTMGAVLALATANLHAEPDDASGTDHAFVDNGRIEIHLTAGTHRITESPDDHIRLRWTVGGNSSNHDVVARTNVDGTSATIHLDGPRRNFNSVIEVPRHSDLVIRLSAGDIDVEKIIGDKDIRLRAGDLSVDVGNVNDYGHVRGSLWAGDIDARPFKLESGGLFRSIEWTGDGEHELRFHLYAGDVSLY